MDRLNLIVDEIKKYSNLRYEIKETIRKDVYVNIWNHEDGNCYSGFPFLDIYDTHATIDSDNKHECNMYGIFNLKEEDKYKIIKFFSESGFYQSDIEDYVKKEKLSCRHIQRWWTSVDFHERIIY